MTAQSIAANAPTCPKEHESRYTKVIQQMSDSGLSQKELGERLGVSHSTISLFRANKYSGDYLAIIKAAEQFFKIQTKAATYRFAAIPTQTSIRTTLFGTLETVLATTSEKQTQGTDAPIAIIVGPPGSGKTSALNAFKLANPKNVFLITISPVSNGFPAVIDELCEQLDIQATGNATKRARKVLNKLLLTGAALIVLDECQHAKQPLLEALRIEFVNKGVGLVLVGNPTIDGTINGVNIGVLSQFRSRVMTRYVINESHLKKDIYEVLHDNKITDASIVQFCQEKLHDLRELSNVINNAIELADGQLLTKEVVSDAYLIKTSHH